MRLPPESFFLFGMGNRPKLLYRRGALLDALTGQVVRTWPVVSEAILPAEYRVDLNTPAGPVTLCENEDAVWLEERGERTALARGRLALPRFESHPHAPRLRVLHHELLISVLAGTPLPNLLAYSRPWYRDGAMLCMCLERTGNLHLVRDWIMGLREPFDRNNAGDCEPDNLGQALYLISLVSSASHPLVEPILAAAARVARGRHIIGRTDGAEHPVYQTKWLKFGLSRLGLDDPYEIPEVFDAYSALFWMDFRDAHVQGPRFDDGPKELYPYLGWAEAHFHEEPPPMDLCGAAYPLSWEAQASQAQYERMAVVSHEYPARRICAPHSWHAAEMLLYLLERT